MLNIVESLPPGLLDAAPTDLHRILPGPTLIHLSGRRREPVFVSILLHGNEYTGLEAIQSVLVRYAGRPLPRALSLFVGNVAAAAKGLRQLDGQPDYNRVWPGGDEAPKAECAMMADVVDRMRTKGVFASIDIHNNTGKNPHYGCINRLDDRTLHLAVLFSRTVVFFRRPLGVQSMAFAPLCPAITIECGRPGEPAAAAHAAALVEAALNLDRFPDHPLPSHDIDLYHTTGVVKIPQGVSFGFDRTDVDLSFDSRLDRLNFCELESGTRIARVRSGHSVPLWVTGEDGEAVSERYFDIVDGELLTRGRIMPAMLTLDERIIRQDCLCYLMERYPLQRP